MAIKKDNKIEKLNTLNEIRSTSMSLQEVRFLTIYLSKINARNPETRIVRFPLEDFRKIMDLGRLSIENIRSSSTRLLQKIASIDKPTGGYNQFPLFDDFTVDKDENDEWYVEINCHDKALPMFFEFKERYFTYELWNALRLSSSNQIRMYEILKQHEKQAEWYCSLSELRGLLFIADNEYPRFGDFKVRILNKCQKALAENTDIKFKYDLTKKGPKVIGITFFIEKNEDYVDQISLDEFINQQPEVEDDGEELSFKNKKLDLFSCVTENEFTEEQLQMLFDMILKIIPIGSSDRVELDRVDYMKRKYNEMNFRKPTESRFGYLKSIIKSDFDKIDF